MLVHAANMAAVPCLSVHHICHWGIWKGMRKRKIKLTLYKNCLFGALDKRQSKDNNRRQLISIGRIPIIYTGFLLRDASAINSKAFMCNIFLNESIISWLSYKSQIQWEHAVGHLEAVSGRMKGLFTREITHRIIHQSYPRMQVALLTSLFCHWKAWISPPPPTSLTIMISSWPPSPLWTAAIVRRPSPQKCGPWTIFRANENWYT